MKFVLSLMIICCIGSAVGVRVVGGVDQAAGASASMAGWDAFSATWQLAGDAGAAETQIKAAIDKATEKMSFLTRGIARGRLANSLKVAKRIRMQREIDMFIIHPDTYTALSMPLSGQTVKHKDLVLRISLESAAGSSALRHSSESPQGKRENVYRLQDGGKTLSMDVTVTSSQIPAPVRYELLYRRVE